jgi:hypothetical protein
MSDPALAPLRLGAGNRHEQVCDTEHRQARPANSMIFINGSSENCRIQRALLWNRCSTGSLFLFPCFQSAIGRRVLDALTSPVEGPLGVPVRRRFPKYKHTVLRVFSIWIIQQSSRNLGKQEPRSKDGWQVSTYSTLGELKNICGLDLGVSAPSTIAPLRRRWKQ